MLTVAVLASSHNVKSLDPIDKVTVTTLKDYPKAREMLQVRYFSTRLVISDNNAYIRGVKGWLGYEQVHTVRSRLEEDHR
jgi:hypothetical protein